MNKYIFKAQLEKIGISYEEFKPSDESKVPKIDEAIKTRAIAIKLEEESQEALRKQKTEGKLYPSTDYTVSFTKDDAMGMLQVKAAFELGLPETVIEFSNGTKLPMVAQDFPAFAKWFVIERASFFKG